MASMSDKIFVAYASRAGSTAGVAEAIGTALAESGAQVDVRLMKGVLGTPQIGGNCAT
jgi:menaquinone-dependent protoporphyrinogen IX oxidase